MRDVSDDEKGNPEIRFRLVGRGPTSPLPQITQTTDNSHDNGRTAAKLGGQLIFPSLARIVDITLDVGRKSNNGICLMLCS